MYGRIEYDDNRPNNIVRNEHSHSNELQRIVSPSVRNNEEIKAEL